MHPPLQEQSRHGFSYDIAPPHDHRVFSWDLFAGCFDETDAASWSARLEAGLTEMKQPDIDRVKSVNVFVWRDASDQRIGVEMLRDRKLQEDAID